MNDPILLKNSRYQVVQESDATAKIASCENLVTNKLVTFPHTSLYLRSKKQVNLFLDYARSYEYAHNLRGVVVPIDRADLLDAIPQEVKNYLHIMIDPMTEAFYYSSLKAEIYRRYALIKDLPPEVAKLLRSPSKKTPWTKKDDEYSENIDTVFLDDNVRPRLATSIPNVSLAKDADIILPFSPLIRNDASSLDAVKRLYDQTRRTFLGGITDIDEENGKRIALYLNVYKGVLGNDRKVNDIIDFIANGEHQALVLKLVLNDDSGIRNLDYDEAFNLMKLMKTIGQYSKIRRVPSHMLCANTLGTLSLLHGFDSYSQPLSWHEVEKEFGGNIEKLRERNPTVDFGRIYSHDVRDFIQHKNYAAIIRRNGKVPACPAGAYCGTFTEKDVLAMQKNAFWDHAKRHLMEIKNYEIDEIIQAINNKEIRGFRSRFKNFFHQFLLPE